MKILSTMLLGMTLALAGGAGCKKAGTAAELASAEALKTKMCACKTPECATAVKTEFKALENTLEAKYKGKEPPKAMEEAWGKIEEAARACQKALAPVVPAIVPPVAPPIAQPMAPPVEPPAGSAAPPAGSGSAK